MKPKSKEKSESLFTLIVILLVFSMYTNAQDWSQWRGPNREGVAQRAGLNLDWLQKKPPLSWTFQQAGAGYSAPVIAGTTLYGQGAADGNDFAFAIDTQT